MQKYNLIAMVMSPIKLIDVKSTQSGKKMSQGTKAADHGKKISMFEALKGEENSTE